MCFPGANFIHMSFFVFAELLVIGGEEENFNHSHMAEIGQLNFTDESHNSRTLQSLNMMRKNKNFCDVVLHVSFVCVILFCCSRDEII